MIRKALIYFLYATISIGLSFISCQQQEDIDPEHGNVELYLLESYETIENTYSQIKETTVQTLDNPLLTYNDFISYNAKEYTFKLTEEAKVKIKDLNHRVNGLAFAVKANNEVIYTGYFWPGYSSMSCDWVVIDPIMIHEENEMMVRLGYPGPIQGITIPDKRNDPQLLEIFRRDNKLIE
jgi:hypothetical protein